MNITLGLTELGNRIKDNLRRELQDLMNDFSKNKDLINSLLSVSPTAYQAFDEIPGSFLTPDKQHIPWGFYMGCEKLPDVKDKGKMFYFPIIHPFQAVTATAVEESNICSDLILNFVLRSIASYPIGRSIVYMMDANISGDFNALSSISTSPEDLDSDKNQFHYATLSSDKDYILNEIAEIIDSNIRNYVSKYKNLSEYNRHNTVMPVPYRFLFVKDIGGTLSENQINDLANLINLGNAAKAGVYIFFSYKKSDITIPGYGSSVNAIKKIVDLSYLLDVPKKRFATSDIELEKKSSNTNIDKTILFVENEKPPLTIMSFKDDINKQLASGKLWENPSSFQKQDGLCIPIGFENAKKIKEIDFYTASSSPHVYVGGQTGSGKTVLLQNLILNGALRYSPEELRYYLVDLKRGVSFVFYKKLPHLAALSASENRYYALSVLELFASEIEQRGNLFRQFKITKLAEFNRQAKTNNTKPLPRLIAIIDEFQELFSENDAIAAKAEKLIKVIHKQGRAFGIILVLSTQSIGGVDTDISQVGIKFSLVSNSKDSTKLIGNDAAASLRGKGRAILNTSETGEKKYNQEFQVAYIDETKELSDYVLKIYEIYLKQNHGVDSLDHLIFDDNAISAKIADNTLLLEYLKTNRQASNNKNNDIFLGMPAFCRKEHVKFHFHRNSQSNMIIVGNDRTSALRLIGAISLQFLNAYKDAEIYISDLQKQSDATYNKLSFLSSLKNEVRCTDDKEIQTTINHIHNILTKRENSPNSIHLQPEILFAIIDIKQNSSFRIKKDPFAIDQEIPPLEMLQNIIDRGPDVGIHVILYGYNDRNIDDLLPGVHKSIEIKIGLRGGNPTKILYGYGTGELVDSNGMAFILMPEDMGLSYSEGETPGDPFVVYSATGNEKLEQTVWGHLFTVLPSKKQQL